MRSSVTRVAVVFTAKPKEQEGWPYQGYDDDKRASEILSKLRARLPNFDFIFRISRSPSKTAEFIRNLDKDKGKDIDGYVVWFLSLPSREAGGPLAYSGKRVVLVDDLFGGTGEFLSVYSRARQRKNPVIGVASSDFQEAVERIKLFETFRKFRETTILDITDHDTVPHFHIPGKMWDMYTSSGTTMKIKEYAKLAQNLFGTNIVTMSSDELRSFYKTVDDSTSEEVAKEWTINAKKIVEPSKDEILKSAKIYLAIKKAMNATKADAVTLDCLRIAYAHKLDAYPCMAWFQLNNIGSVGVCEADLDSTFTSLMGKYIANRPGFVSDPVIDQKSNQIIYAHCVATNKPFGPAGPSNPYILRSHAEDNKGVSVQSLFPVGHFLTTAKIAVTEKALILHSAISIGNLDEERACRTKLVAQVSNAKKLIENWSSQKDTIWHRVTFYGNFVEIFKDFGKLSGLEVIEEDK